MKKVGYFFYTFLPVLLAFGMEFIATFFILGITVFFFSGSSSLDLNMLTNLVSDTNFNAALSIIFSTLVIATFGIWYYYRFEGNYLPKPSDTFHPFPFIGIILLVPAVQIVSGLIISILSAIHPAWLEYYEKLMETAGMDENIGLLMLVYSVILAPVGEELVFRGVTMRAARRALPFWLANIMQAFLFGCFHMNMIQGCYAFVAGLILGFICEKCGSIYYSIFFHIVFNFWGTVISTRIESALTHSSNETFFIILFYAVIVIAAIAGIFFLYKGICWKKSKGTFTEPHQVMEDAISS